MVIWERHVDYNKIDFHPLHRKQGERGKYTFAQEIAAFDIETSRVPDLEQSFMYVWQFAIDQRLCIMGRTWEEWLHMMQQLRVRLKGLRLLVFVHNLNYEGTFISSPQIYQFENKEVFSVDAHKILRMTMYKGTFEFRCSYLLTNLSLDSLTRRFNCQYRKRSGEAFDYSKLRLPSTPLSRREILYCAYDVLGLTEAIRGLLDLNKDDLYTLPYTQTGFVRREAKRMMRPYHFKIQDCFPNELLFQTLRNAFRGGNTHGNRYMVESGIIENVHGIDISSSYPAQQVLERYPVEPFQRTGSLSLTGRFLDQMMDWGYCVVMEVRFWGIRLKYEYEPIPYIPRAKCLDQWKGIKDSFVMDNGRVLRAVGVPLTMAMTEVDFRIIASQYCWDRMEILKMWTAKSGPMYEGLRQLNIDLFTAKTKLKGLDDQKIYYDRAKEMLNSIYGMSCQNPLQPAILFSDPDHPNDFNYSFKTDRSLSDGELLKIAQKKAFITYQLGCYTTAHARAELQRAIDLRKDSVIYCDTDSVMYTGDRPGLEELNEEYRQRDLAAGGYADDSFGNRHYMGVFECEDDPRHGYKYHRFVTLGAKKYAFEKWNKKTDKLEVGITVAGVPKKAGAKELAAKGGLEAFRSGFVFSECDKLGVTYNEDYGKAVIDGEEINITRNACLSPVTYTLSFENDYKSLLEMITEEKLEKITRNSIF